MRVNEKKKVLKPWRPIQATENGTKNVVSVWGRDYVVDASALFTSIISQKQEILSAPMRIVAKENGKLVEWEHQSNYLMSAEKDAAVICGIQKSKAFVFNTAINIEYDGLVTVNLKVVPKGPTGAEIFGHETSEKVGYNLEQLWVEIPLKREVAKLYQISCANAVNGADDATADVVVRNSGRVAVSMSTSFSPLVSLSGGEIGFSYFCESAEYWQPAQEDTAIEILVSEQEVVLRLHLLDSFPVSWKMRGNSTEEYSFFPLNYEFGFMVTPVKPYPKNPYKRRILHLSIQEGEMPYDEYLNTPSPSLDNVSPYDYMKKMGVTTFILHENWNTTQNYWEIPLHRQSMIKNIIRECHRRGIEFVPYFGYEISSLGAYWKKELVENIVRKQPDEEGWFGWYRKPFQRDYIVCYRSMWRDKLVEGIQNLVDEYDIDGVYVDLGMSACQNENHGCGYHDHEGKLQPTYPIIGVRELMRGLYSIFEPIGGMVDSHQGASFNFPCRSFVHSNFTGEEIIWFIKDNGAEQIPMEYFDFTLNGRGFGTPVDYIVGEYPPDWTFKRSYAVSLLNGVLPRPQSFENLKLASQVWRAVDAFPVEKSEWHFYAENKGEISSSEEDIKISYYQQTDGRGKKSILAFVTNPTKHEHKAVKVKFSETVISDASAYDMLENKYISCDNNTVSLDFGEFGWYILLLNEE